MSSGNPERSRVLILNFLEGVWREGTVIIVGSIIV